MSAREPAVPLGVWALGLCGLFAAWLLAGPLLLPQPLVLAVAVLLSAALTGVVVALIRRAVYEELGRPDLRADRSSAGSASGPAAARAAGGGAILGARIAWCCAQPRCPTRGWAECPAGVFIDAELHAIACHPGAPATFRLIGATVAGARLRTVSR